MGEVAQPSRASLCQSLIPCGLDASCCSSGLHAHQKENDDAVVNPDFTHKDYKSPSEVDGLLSHVKESLGSLILKETEVVSDGKFSQVSPGKQLDVCSPFLLSLFVALAPLEHDSLAFTPCQPAVHIRPASLPKDLLTPESKHKTYIDHISNGGDKDLFCEPLETIIYSTDPEAGAAISPVEILDRCQFRKTAIGSLANHIKSDHVEEAFRLLVTQHVNISQFVPKHLQDQKDAPIVLFFALLSALHEKYNGLKSDNDWLSMLSALSGLNRPQHDLSVSSTADLHYITRVIFAEKVHCKIAISKGLRRFLLTYHISHSEYPPEEIQHILSPRHLHVSDNGILSDPCPLSVTATAGISTMFEQMIAQDRSKRMKEAWVEKERRRPSSLQDYLLEWLAELKKDQSTCLLTSSKQLSESLTKTQQTQVFKQPRIQATTVLLEVYKARRNVEVTQMVHEYQEDYKEKNPDSPDDWEAKLTQSLSTDIRAKKMTGRTKAGSLNLLVSILTQMVFIVDGPDGCPQLENADLLFQVVRQNGHGKHKPWSSKMFDPLLCKDNLRMRWQTIIFQSREAIVNSISTLIENRNKGLVENVIRPRATTLVLRLVAHFGTNCVSVPANCRSTMPSFCALVFDNTKEGVVHAYCKFIAEYVRSLLEEHKGLTEKNIPWLPLSLQDWVKDSQDQTKKSLGLMPQLTLAKTGINESENQSMCVSKLLVFILEHPRHESPTFLKTSVERHSQQILQTQQQEKERKRKQKIQEKKPDSGTNPSYIDIEAKGDHSDSEVSQGGNISPLLDESEEEDDKASRIIKPCENPASPLVNDSQPVANCCAGAPASDETPTNRVLLYSAQKPKHGLTPQSNDMLQLGSEGNLGPNMHKFLTEQLSLNHGALPNALVNMVETSVQYMAKQRFKNCDNSLLESFNTPCLQTKRRKLNAELVGNVYVALAQVLTLHAQDLDEHHHTPAAIDWEATTGYDGDRNVIQGPRKAYHPTELQIIGKELLGGGLAAPSHKGHTPEAESVSPHAQASAGAKDATPVSSKASLVPSPAPALEATPPAKPCTGSSSSKKKWKVVAQAAKPVAKALTDDTASPSRQKEVKQSNQASSPHHPVQSSPTDPRSRVQNVEECPRRISPDTSQGVSSTATVVSTPSPASARKTLTPTGSKQFIKPSHGGGN